MRLRALVGGLLIVATATLSHRPSGTTHGTGYAERLSCSALDTAGFCGAVAGFSTALYDPILRMNRSNILPPVETPGAIDPAITQANIDTTICQPGYSRAARPSHALTSGLKRRLMVMQHPGETAANYELDHLIPISLGGAPFDKRDLWLQPRRGQANAGNKNDLAYVLWRLVCEHRLPLGEAQHAISQNWTIAFATYATAENIAKYKIPPSNAEYRK